MNAVPFDTLKMAQRLEAARFAASQAAGASEALIGADLATKADIAGVRSEIAALRTELKGDVGALRAQQQGDATSLRTELKGDIATLSAEVMAAIELLRRDMTIRLGGMMVVAVGVLLAAMRYMPPHP